jgi:hypothetical protein
MLPAAQLLHEPETGATEKLPLAAPKEAVLN